VIRAAIARNRYHGRRRPDRAFVPELARGGLERRDAPVQLLGPPSTSSISVVDSTGAVVQVYGGPQLIDRLKQIQQSPGVTLRGLYITGHGGGPPDGGSIMLDATDTSDVLEDVGGVIKINGVVVTDLMKAICNGGSTEIFLSGCNTANLSVSLSKDLSGITAWGTYYTAYAVGNSYFSLPVGYYQPFQNGQPL
jgi:hypothetical protein